MSEKFEGNLGIWFRVFQDEILDKRNAFLEWNSNLCVLVLGGGLYKREGRGSRASEVNAIKKIFEYF